MEDQELHPSYRTVNPVATLARNVSPVSPINVDLDVPPFCNYQDVSLDFHPGLLLLTAYFRFIAFSCWQRTMCGGLGGFLTSNLISWSIQIYGKQRCYFRIFHVVRGLAAIFTVSVHAHLHER